MKHSFYCLIPAKGTSKSIPRKNLAKIKGKSLVELTILTAKKSNLIKEIFVSSEAKRILSIANKLGVNYVKRSKKYSVGDIEPKFVVFEFLKKIKYIRKRDFIVYLQPTSPLRKTHHINSAIKKILKKNKKSLTSVVESDNKIFKSLVIKNDNIYPIFDENNFTTSRQKLNKIYLPNGAIYIFKVSEFLRKGNFPIKNSISFLMTKKFSQDVDTLNDLKIVKKNYN